MDEKKRRKVLGMIPYGLYVISTRCGEEINAFTATWVTQASFDPPLVVIAVKKGSSSHDMIKDSSVFAVNFLGKDQRKLAEHFVRSPATPQEKFTGIPFETDVTGAPLLVEALAYLECIVVSRVNRGDHSIFVGEVAGVGLRREERALTLEDAGWRYGG